MTLESSQNCHIDIDGPLKCFCVCGVSKQLTLQYLGLSVISPLHALPLQQVSRRVYAPYSLSPHQWRDSAVGDTF